MKVKPIFRALAVSLQQSGRFFAKKKLSAVSKRT